jgi:tetratricopeptide (TPR) repeat protein
MKINMFLVMVFALILTSISYAQKEIEDCYTYIGVSDYQKAIESGQRAVELYPKNSDAYFCLGIAYYQTGQIDLAIDNLKKAESYATKDEDLMFIYNFLGLNYEKKGDLDNALFYYSKSLNLAKILGNREMEASGLSNIANIFSKKGDLNRALEYYEESLRLKTDEKSKAPTYNNIALIYLDIGNYKRAIEYFKKAIEIAERYGDYHKSGIIMLNLGDVYRRVKDFKNAYYYLSEGLKRVQKVGDKYSEGIGLAYLGWYFRDKGDIRSAREYLNIAYEIFKSIGAERNASAVLKDLSDLDKIEKNKNKKNKK